MSALVERAFGYLFSKDGFNVLMRVSDDGERLVPCGGDIDYGRFPGPDDAVKHIFHEQTGLMIPAWVRFCSIDSIVEGQEHRNFYMWSYEEEGANSHVIVPGGQRELQWVNTLSLIHMQKIDPYSRFLVPMALALPEIAGPRRFQMIERYSILDPRNRRW